MFQPEPIIKQANVTLRFLVPPTKGAYDVYYLTDATRSNFPLGDVLITALTFKQVMVAGEHIPYHASLEALGIDEESIDLTFHHTVRRSEHNTEICNA